MMKGSAYERVRASFADLLHELIGADSAPSFLVALSGGADSSLLLPLMMETGYPVAAAHLHHGIRGEEADRDEDFCADRCRALDVPFFHERADVPALAAARGMGLEEAAREIRYEFLSQTAQERGYTFIVTAHNADDNLETVLFHLIRGSSLRGLGGIPPRRDNLLRPLLACTKEDILAACREKEIPFVTDSSNEDRRYTRNFLRHEVIPLLRRINPGVAESVYGTASLLREDEAYLSAEAASFSLTQGRSVLSALPDPLLARVLIRELKAEGVLPERDHVRAAITALRSEAAHVSLSLPRGTLLLDRDTVTVGVSREELPSFDVPLHLGLNQLENGTCLYLSTSDRDQKDINTLINIYKFETKACLDSATINRNLRARSRRPGDTLKSGGLTRSVKKLLQSLKTPLAQRNRLPFVTDGEEILWIPGLPVADSAIPRDPHSVINVYYFS